MTCGGKDPCETRDRIMCTVAHKDNTQTCLCACVASWLDAHIGQTIISALSLDLRSWKVSVARLARLGEGRPAKNAPRRMVPVAEDPSSGAGEHGAQHYVVCSKFKELLNIRSRCEHNT